MCCVVCVKLESGGGDLKDVCQVDKGTDENDVLSWTEP